MAAPFLLTSQKGIKMKKPLKLIAATSMALSLSACLTVQQPQQQQQPSLLSADEIANKASTCKSLENSYNRMGVKVISHVQKTFDKSSNSNYRAGAVGGRWVIFLKPSMTRNDPKLENYRVSTIKIIKKSKELDCPLLQRRT